MAKKFSPTPSYFREALAELLGKDARKYFEKVCKEAGVSVLALQYSWDEFTRICNTFKSKGGILEFIGRTAMTAAIVHKNEFKR